MTLWPVRVAPPLPTAYGPTYGPEAGLLLQISRSLSPQQARHVALVTAKGVTANSAALQAALQVGFTEFDPPMSPDPSALPAQGAQSHVQIECRDENSGPYRRVYSRPGYAYQHSRVYLPTTSQGEVYENKAAGDTAFVYLGGWGVAGGAVDAGLQHGHYLGGVADDWAPFFLVQQPSGPSAMTVSTDKQAGGAPWRLAAGQVAEVQFWVSQQGDLTMLNLFVSGLDSQQQQPSSLTLCVPVDSAFGWSAAGGGNILKRMTTIGQKTGQQNLASGSYLHGVDWQESQIGVSGDVAGAWLAEQTGGYCTFPAPDSPQGQRSDGQGSKWVIGFQDAGREKDSVDLL